MFCETNYSGRQRSLWFYNSTEPHGWNWETRVTITLRRKEPSTMFFSKNSVTGIQTTELLLMQDVKDIAAKLLSVYSAMGMPDIVDESDYKELWSMLEPLLPKD